MARRLTVPIGADSTPGLVAELLGPGEQFAALHRAWQEARVSGSRRVHFIAVGGMRKTPPGPQLLRAPSRRARAYDLPALDAGVPDRVARSLLLAEPHRLTTGAFGQKQSEETQDYLTRVAVSPIGLQRRRATDSSDVRARLGPCHRLHIRKECLAGGLLALDFLDDLLESHKTFGRCWMGRCVLDRAG